MEGKHYMQSMQYTLCEHICLFYRDNTENVQQHTQSERSDGGERINAGPPNHRKVQVCLFYYYFFFFILAALFICRDDGTLNTGYANSDVSFRIFFQKDTGIIIAREKNIYIKKKKKEYVVVVVPTISSLSCVKNWES